MSPIVFFHEILQSIRGLLRRPRYLALAALTLALGISATSAVFTLLHQNLLRPLPMPEPERLVTIGAELEGGGHIGSPALYRALEGMPGLESAGIVTAFTRKFGASVGDLPTVCRVMSADRRFLQTLGVRMALGRNIDAEEDRADGPRVAVLHHRFWQREFGGSPDALQRVFRIEGREYRAIGVLPEDFSWPEPFDLIVPMRLPQDSTDLDGNQHIVARFAAGADPDSNSAETQRRAQRLLDRLRARISPEKFDYLAGLRYSARPLDTLYRGETSRTLWLFFAAACCVLAIAAINLTNLVMLRAVVRSHENAVRTALGASPLRLAIPALGEALAIGVAGGASGVVLAALSLGLLRAVAPHESMQAASTTLEPVVLVFALTVGLGTALIATLVGVWRSGRIDLPLELTGGGRSGLSRRVGWLGRALVCAQVALAALLLMTGGLFVRDLHRLSSMPLGFESAGIVTFSLSPVRSVYPDIAAVRRQSEDVLARIRGIPGVRMATLGSNLPAGSQLNLPVTLETGVSTQPQFRVVDTGYFELFDIALHAGRSFAAGDSAGAEPVCIVSRSFAELHFGGDALGKTVRIGRPGDERDHPPMRIVGIVDDVRYQGPGETGVPTLYVPLAQLPDRVWMKVREFSALGYAVRTADGVAAIEPRLRRAVVEASPDQPIADIRTMRAIVEETFSRSRLQLVLVGAFAALALLLAAVGLYAILAVTVAARSHEYGVRVALGAKPAHLVMLILKDGAFQIGLGLAVGLAAALAFSRALSGFLIDAKAIDPIVMIVVALVLASAGLAASLIPALRIARSDPMRALRCG
jgi:putative ABC transport system permease protein